jgi:hypothetical protein
MTAYLVDATPTGLTGPGPPYTTLRDSTPTYPDQPIPTQPSPTP